jgi:hypothetical protein
MRVLQFAMPVSPGHFSIFTREGAEFLDAQVQFSYPETGHHKPDEPCIWMQVPSEGSQQKYDFILVETTPELPAPSSAHHQLLYRKTILLADGRLVLHLYQEFHEKDVWSLMGERHALYITNNVYDPRVGDMVKKS